jgi:Tol biopolymer transport system component/DNA-binding winged helix-turn-helix (wHTH) protein
MIYLKARGQRIQFAVLRSTSYQTVCTFRFGAYEVDLWTGELHKDGTKLKVQEQPLKLLAMLIARPGELVSREQLRDGLWSNDTFVDFDRGLNTAVKRLRDALCDSAENPRFVETVGSRGYRFIAPISTENLDQPEAGPQLAPASARVCDWPSDVAQRLPADSGRADAQHEPPGARTVFGKRLWLGAVLIFFIAAGVGYGIRRWRSHSAALPDFESLRLTRLTNSGKAEDVAISPDGRYVAYLFRDGDNTSLRLRQVKESGEAEVLVHDPLLFPGVAFSSDGSHLYFLRARPKDTLLRDLYEIPALGGAERKVAPNIDSAVSFSPDGRQFVYESGMPRKDSIEIRIANADGSGDRLLVEMQGAFAGYNPGAAWSPDGKSIAVPVWMHHEKNGNVLDVIDAADGTVRTLYSGNQAVGRPRWLPGEDMLVVPINDESGRTQLWTVSYPAGKARRLTNDLADYDSAIDTTRDGRMLATVQWAAISNLWASPLGDGSGGKQLTFDEQVVTSVFPVDGKLAMANRADHGLWVMDPDGAHRKLVADARRAGWFAGCGRFILFVSDRSGAQELVRIDEDGANPKVLATGLIWGESCSPDAKFVYYPQMSKPRWKIKRVPIDGGTPVDVAENPGEAMPGRVAISPDGALLAFPYDVVSSEPTLKIGVVSIAGGPLLKDFDVPNSIEGPRWAPAGQSLQYLWDTNGATNLWEQPVTGGPPHQLTKFTSGRIFDFNWTADGKQLLLARGEVTSDVVLLSNLR